ncbi:MAG TPA: hypothetical protein VMT46_08835 [Anaerolineaceae bacterium]|nr:hypothetical protein [Anaerolineaceae bacterium]
MTKQISPKDWQTLSEYLDGQLPERERVQVEARLQTSPELSSGYDELKRTKAILRNLPKRRAPRNFTLSSAMVPQKRATPRAFPYLRLASALASFLLVMTFLGDLAVHSLNFGASSATSTGINQSAPAAVPAATQAPAEENPQPFLKSAPSSGQGLNPPAATEAANSAAAQTEAPAAPAPLAPQGTPEPGTEPGARSMAIPQPTPDATEIARMTAAPPGMGGGEPASAPPAAPESPTLEAPPALQAQRAPGNPSIQSAPAPSEEVQPYLAAPAQDQGPVPTEAPQPSAFDPSTLLRPAEILFAVIAVVTGLAAFIIQRNNRG